MLDVCDNADGVCASGGGGGGGAMVTIDVGQMGRAAVAAAVAAGVVATVVAGYRVDAGSVGDGGDNCGKVVAVVGDDGGVGANDDEVWRLCLLWLLWCENDGNGREPRSLIPALPRRRSLVLLFLPKQVRGPVREIEESEYDGEEDP